MFLVASVIAPAVANAANPAVIKVTGAPTFNPPVSSGSFTVHVVANSTTTVKGASTGLQFDTSKLTLTNLVNTMPAASGVSGVGFPVVDPGPPAIDELTPLLAALNGAGGTVQLGGVSTVVSAGHIPNMGWATTGTARAANTDLGIFDATFTIKASGDSTLHVEADPVFGGVLDGNSNPVAYDTQDGVVHNSFQPIWSIAAPASATVLTGADSAGSTITTTVTQGTPGAIALSATGLPSGVTFDFNPTSITNAGTSTLTFHASAGATVGQSTVTVTGTDPSSVTHSAQIQLTVAGNNDFSISATPNSLSVNGGATSSAVNVLTAILTGAPGTINLSATGLPTGVTANFLASSVAAGGATTVTFSADNTALNGVSSITIHGITGTYDHTAAVSLNVIVITGVGATVNVTGTLDAGFLGLTCPTGLSIPLLRGNTNQLNVPCQVYTNTVWNLSVADTQTDAYQGHMVTGRPVGGSNYAIPDSMHVLSRSFVSGGDTFYANNLDLANGNGTSCSVLQQPCAPANQGSLSGGVVLNGTNSASAPLVLSQYVAPNTQPGSYGMQVLFKAVSVF
jgi:hypothetical protein